MNRWNFALVFVAVLLIFSGGGVPDIPPNSNGEFFNYRPLVKVAPERVPLNQGPIGTCVAAGHAGAADELLAFKFVTGKAAKWLPASIESIYGLARNEGKGRISHSYSDGSNGYAATQALAKYGVIYAQAYPKHNVDLTKYDTKRAKDWGATGNGGKDDGLDGPLDYEAKSHPIRSAKVTTLKELDVALKNVWPVTICSSVGFDSPRDKDGFCQPRGSWAHCMRVSGKRESGRTGYLIQNSWGAYIKGDGPNPEIKNKFTDQPDGSFYIEPAVMQRILNAGDSWALTDAEGWKPNILPFWMRDAHAEAPLDPQPSPDRMPQPTEPARWHSDYNDAKRHADETGKPLLVYFGATWCGNCPAAKQDVEDAVGPHLASVSAVQLDVDKNEELAQKLGIRSVPQVLFYDADGKGVRLVGGREIRSLSKRIEAAISK